MQGDDERAMLQLIKQRRGTTNRHPRSSLFDDSLVAKKVRRQEEEPTEQVTPEFGLKTPKTNKTGTKDDGVASHIRRSLHNQGSQHQRQMTSTGPNPPEENKSSFSRRRASSMTWGYIKPALKDWKLDPQKLKEEANRCATRTLKLLIKSLPQVQELPISSRLDTLMKLLVESLPKCTGSPALSQALGDMLSMINLGEICKPPETEGENLPPVFFESKRTAQDTSAYQRELNRNRILKMLHQEIESAEANFEKREKYIQQREAQMNREILMWFLEMRINKRSMIGEADLSKINHELSMKLTYFVNDLSVRGKNLHEIMDEVMKTSIHLKNLIEQKDIEACKQMHHQILSSCQLASAESQLWKMIGRETKTASSDSYSPDQSSQSSLASMDCLY